MNDVQFLVVHEVRYAAMNCMPPSMFESREILYFFPSIKQ